MTGGMYLLQGDDDLIAMTEAPYDSEDVLQALLAKYPDLLAGDQLPGSEPRRWLLIRHEAPLGSDDSGATRWSIDHLFLDQDAVPTLVETKRSSDTRIRREVVGQMLDYAANAVVYWPIEEIQSALERRCEKESLDPETEVTNLIGSEVDLEEFWKRAAVNLQAGRVRLVLVADQIPRELRRVVEFLNEQMTPAEVIAIEVKQYVGDGVKTLVPRVIGQTAGAETKKQAGGPRRKWDEERFFSFLSEHCDSNAVKAAHALIQWAEDRGLRISWGSGKVYGSFIPVLEVAGRQYWPIAVFTHGRVEVQFQHMYQPPFDSFDLRKELLERLNQVPGVSIPEDAITGRPRLSLSDLGRNPKMLSELKAVLDWFCETARNSN